MKRIFAFILSVILVFSFAFAVSAKSFPAAEVSLVSNYDTVDIGEEVKVTLSFDNASEYPYGLAAFCSYLTYDSRVLRVKSINAAVPRSSIRHNSMSGELRSVYTFASAQGKPGFNTNGPFYTVVFEAVAIGYSNVNVTFDAITVTDYYSDELNFRVEFNSPSVNVTVNGDESVNSTENTSSAVSSEKASSTTPSSSKVSSTAPSSSKVSSTATSSNKASSKAENAVSSAKPVSSNQTNGSANSKTPVESTENKPVKPNNDKFQDVADSGQDTVQDVFDESGEIIEQTESKAPNKPSSSNSTQAGSDEIDKSETNGVPNIIIVVSAIVLVGIVGAVVAVVLLKRKK